MLRKRIIFTLIYSDGFFMQSRNFRLQKVGNVAWVDQYLQLQKISFSLDELIILNASRNDKSTQNFAKIINHLASNVFIPVAAGGNIRTIQDAEMLFKQGADKIIVNSMLMHNQSLIHELVNCYGSQSIVASIDYKKINGIHEVYIFDGTTKIDLQLSDYIEYIQNLKIGEIYLNSIDRDGTGFGYDFETISQIKDEIKVPLIIAGGVGNEQHLFDGLNTDRVHAVATANLFNFLGDGLPNARKKLLSFGLNIAPFDS